MISDRVKRRQLEAIPIFYRLDPSTVKGMRGHFGDAFMNLPESDATKEVWKKALMSIYNQHGIIVEKGRDENRILEIIVDAVETVLKKNPSDGRKKDKTIGIKQPLKELGEDCGGTDRIQGSTETARDNVTRIPNRTLINSPIVIPPTLYCEVKPPQIQGPTKTLRDNVTRTGNRTRFNSPVVTPPMYREVKPPQRQVFINFRGVQVRNNFVVYLVDALKRRGVNVFIDNLERRGKDLSTLFKRIEESGIAIVVFSSRYTINWCLNELVEIKECAHQGTLEVFPIFYKVDPTNVKRLEGEFGDNFRDKEYRYGYDSPLIKSWKEAIVFVTEKHALVFDENSRQPENHFVETIVKEVLKMLQAYSDSWKPPFGSLTFVGRSKSQLKNSFDRNESRATK